MRLFVLSVAKVAEAGGGFVRIWRDCGFLILRIPASTRCETPPDLDWQTLFTIDQAALSPPLRHCCARDRARNRAMSLSVCQPSLFSSLQMRDWPIAQTGILRQTPPISRRDLDETIRAVRLRGYFLVPPVIMKSFV